MKFRFTIQPYQTEAVNCVVRVFDGQPAQSLVSYRRDVGVKTKKNNKDEKKRKDLDNMTMFTKTEDKEDEKNKDDEIGYANANVFLDSDEILRNIHHIQDRNNIKHADTLTNSLGICSLDVEMETGTGKTYVYIKTIFELNKRYGWSKFVVVVPSIAIREGVNKSFQVMEDHFMEHYGKKARFFVYDSKNLSRIDSFSQNADISVMIINTQAFNASFNEDKNVEGRKGDSAARIIFSIRDTFQSRRPIDVIAANRPIIIMDEPQKMGGPATQNALKKFNPLFCLNFSATHKQHHELVYALDALDAYNKRLVKRIEVMGFDIKNLRGTDGYLFLENIVLSHKKPPRARMEFEVHYEGRTKRQTKLFSEHDNLFELSNGMEQYRGYTVSDIDPERGTVTFTNDEAISIGEVRGDVSEKDLRRVQIRETIRSHFDKERDLFNRGIKTLSLFFIDKVAKYRDYDEDGNEVNSEYGEIFEQEYIDILNETLTLYNTPYEQYLRGIDPHETHAGYFSIDKRGRKVDSKLRRGSDESDDVSAYDLIMKDKERLLSFDNPVRFIFSHSALREGWDNPNVFQICTLKHGGSSPAQKRQEVGRGLRLCVNQNGDRMDYDVLGNQVQEINQLTVIAADGYTQFVTDLQRGIRDDLYDRPTQATKEYFAGKTLIINNQEITITKEQANTIHRYLIRNEYVDDADHITDAYRTDSSNQTLAPLPDSLTDIADGVHALIRSVFDESALKGMIGNGGKPVPPKNELNNNFYNPDFKALWNLINRKYTYFVEYDSAELIRAAIQRINERASLFSSKLRYVSTTGKQVQDMNVEGVKNGDSFETTKSRTETLKHFTGSSVPYDLIGKIAEGTRLTRRTATAILKGIHPEIFGAFQENPEDFIDKVVRLINEPKAETIVTRLTYNRTNGRFSKEIFNVDKHTDFSNAILTAKSVQDYVFTDGYAKDGNSNEARFVNALEGAEEVIVYAKLPRGFYIPTPFGKYTPDWAIAFDKKMVKYIYFVAETKGSINEADLREVEADKIKCARRLFGSFSTEDIRYDTVDSYEHLRDIVMGNV